MATPGTNTPTGITTRAGQTFYWRYRAVEPVTGIATAYSPAQNFTIQGPRSITQTGRALIVSPRRTVVQVGRSRIKRVGFTKTQVGVSRILIHNQRVLTQVGRAWILPAPGALQPPLTFLPVTQPSAVELALPQTAVRFSVETVISQIQGQMSSSTAYSQVVFDPDGAAVQKILSGVDIIQCEGSHDICVVQVRGSDPTVPELTTGTPVHVRYGWGPAMVEDFYGYINHVSPPYKRQVYGEGYYTMDVVLVGTSYVFKQGMSRVYRDITASSVIESLATTNYFSSMVETGDVVWDQLICSGMSAWEFMRDLAARLGWLLKCNKSQLTFMSYDRALARNLAVMPTFLTKSAANLATQETISSFEVLQGETVGLPGHTKALRVLSGVDKRSGLAYTVQNDTLGLANIAADTQAPIFSAMQTDTVSGNSLFAQSQVDSVVQKNRWHIQAHAVLNGDPNVVQGVPIVLSGIDSNNDGIWYVQKVHHKIEFNSYTTEVWLGRDSTGDLGIRSRSSPFVAWSLTDPYAGTNSTAPPTNLVSGRWRAAFASNMELKAT